MEIETQTNPNEAELITEEENESNADSTATEEIILDMDYIDRILSEQIECEAENKEIEITSIESETNTESEPYLWSTLDEDWNLDDLLVEILFAVLHKLAADDEQIEAEDVFAYLKGVFHKDDETFAALLKAAKEKSAPSLYLNLEVVEAKGLHGKDANGLSDPLCTVFISKDQKYSTTMKPETLTPVWNEHFTFPLTNIDEDMLNLEIWDYDPEESIGKKFKRIKEVKSAKGLRILMKDIVTTKSSKKQQDQNDFMGCTKLTLNKISSYGLEKWFPIEGRPENGLTKPKGEIRLRMVLRTEKNRRLAGHDYLRLFHLMLIHELAEHKVDHYEWSGKFTSPFAEYILHQLEWQGGLTHKQIDLAKWFAIAKIHCVHPINSIVVPNIFQNVADALEMGLIAEDWVQKLWFTTEKLVENYMAFIFNIHHHLAYNSKFAVQVNNQLITMGLVKNHMERHRDKVGNIHPDLKLTPEFIVEKVKDVLVQGAEEFYTHCSLNDPDDKEAPIKTMIKIGGLLNKDLTEGLETSQFFFKRLLGIDFFEVTYRVYDKKYGQVVSPIIEAVCKDLKRLDLKEAGGDSVEEDLSMGTTLFELYLTVRQFANHSSNLLSTEGLHIAGEFHNWFYASVAQWLDIAFYKGVSRIKKAVELDTLQAIDKYVQRSSSAVDTAHVFHQIQEFWAKLAWPEAEGSYTFIAKILDESCRCNVLYSEILCKKLEQLERSGKRSGDKYEISDEVCSAVNNMEYLGAEMSSISEKLGTEKVMVELAALKGENITAHCKNTLETVIENAEESIHDKLHALLENVGCKLRPPLERLVKKGMENSNEEEAIGKLMKYLDTMLTKLKTRTSEGAFEKIFVVVWEVTCTTVEYYVKKSVAKKRQPAIFNRLLMILEILVGFFHPDENTAAQIKQNERIKNLFEILDLRAATTPELILKYQQRRYEYQTSLPQRPGAWGLVTIRAQYCVDIRTLRIQVLNARNLRATDSNGSSDPFVVVRVVPKQMYTTLPKFKTAVKKETLFPLFDESFSMTLTAEDIDRLGLIQLLVKDHDVIGKNDYLGEAFLPLDAIPVTKSDTELKDLPQRNLVLHSPVEWESPVFQNLESRKRDKVAVKFVKKERGKLPPEPDEPTQ